MSLKLECLLIWNLTQTDMSLKLECNLNLNVTQIGMSLKLECYSNCEEKMLVKTAYRIAKHPCDSLIN